MKLIILQNFSVRVIDRHGVEGRVAYGVGMVVDGKDVPPGQTADGWVAKGLAKQPPHPLDHDGDGRLGGSLPKSKR